jgi:hypothetical protein
MRDDTIAIFSGKSPLYLNEGRFLKFQNLPAIKALQVAVVVMAVNVLIVPVTV